MHQRVWYAHGFWIYLTMGLSGIGFLFDWKHKRFGIGLLFLCVSAMRDEPILHNQVE